MNKIICIIENKVLGCAVTDIFTVKNENEAIVGFSQFLKNCKDIPSSAFNLLKIGYFDLDNLTIIMNDLNFENEVICKGSECESKLSEIYKED